MFKKIVLLWACISIFCMSISSYAWAKDGDDHDHIIRYTYDHYIPWVPGMDNCYGVYHLLGTRAYQTTELATGIEHHFRQDWLQGGYENLDRTIADYAFVRELKRDDLVVYCDFLLRAQRREFVGSHLEILHRYFYETPYLILGLTIDMNPVYGAYFKDSFLGIPSIVADRETMLYYTPDAGSEENLAKLFMPNFAGSNPKGVDIKTKVVGHNHWAFIMTLQDQGENIGWWNNYSLSTLAHIEEIRANKEKYIAPQTHSDMAGILRLRKNIAAQEAEHGGSLKAFDSVVTWGHPSPLVDVKDFEFTSYTRPVGEDKYIDKLTGKHYSLTEFVSPAYMFSLWDNMSKRLAGDRWLEYIKSPEFKKSSNKGKKTLETGWIGLNKNNNKLISPYSFRLDTLGTSGGKKSSVAFGIDLPEPVKKLPEKKFEEVVVFGDSDYTFSTLAKDLALKGPGKDLSIKRPSGNISFLDSLIPASPGVWVASNDIFTDDSVSIVDMSSDLLPWWVFQKAQSLLGFWGMSDKTFYKLPQSKIEGISLKDNRDKYFNMLGTKLSFPSGVRYYHSYYTDKDWGKWMDPNTSYSSRGMSPWAMLAKASSFFMSTVYPYVSVQSIFSMDKNGPSNNIHYKKGIKRCFYPYIQYGWKDTPSMTKDVIAKAETPWQESVNGMKNSSSYIRQTKKNMDSEKFGEFAKKLGNHNINLLAGKSLETMGHIYQMPLTIWGAVDWAKKHPIYKSYIYKGVVNFPDWVLHEQVQGYFPVEHNRGWDFKSWPNPKEKPIP